MRHEVLITEGAEHDLEEIYSYIAEAGSQHNADHVPSRLFEVAESLATYPERGSHPREPLALGIREYRQVFFKPYRIIYRIIGKQVFIYVIADGRQDMQSLLSRRLLGS